MKDSIWWGGYFSRQNLCPEIISGARPAQDLEASILRRPVHILICNEWQEKNKFQTVSSGCRFCMQCFITAATTGYDKNYKSTLLKTSPKHSHSLS
jgi:hypothetical protein